MAVKEDKLNLEAAIRKEDESDSEQEVLSENEILLFAKMEQCIEGMNVFSKNYTSANQSTSSTYKPQESQQSTKYEDPFRRMAKLIDRTQNIFTNSNTSNKPYANKIVPVEESRARQRNESNYARLKLVASSVAVVLSPILYSANSYRR